MGDCYIIAAKSLLANTFSCLFVDFFKLYYNQSKIRLVQGLSPLFVLILAIYLDLGYNTHDEGLSNWVDFLHCCIQIHH